MNKLRLATALLMVLRADCAIDPYFYGFYAPQNYECLFNTYCQEYGFYYHQSYCCALWDCTLDYYNVTSNSMMPILTQGTQCSDTATNGIGNFKYGNYTCNVTCSNLPASPCLESSYCSIFGPGYCCANWTAVGDTTPPSYGSYQLCSAEVNVGALVQDFGNTFNSECLPS